MGYKFFMEIGDHDHPIAKSDRSWGSYRLSTPQDWRLCYQTFPLQLSAVLSYRRYIFV